MSLGFFPLRPSGGDVLRTDFREYATGAAPSGWSITLGTGQTATVETVSGSISGKALSISPTANQWFMGRWERVPDREDSHVLARVRISTPNPASNVSIGVVVRFKAVGECYHVAEWNSGANIVTRYVYRHDGANSAFVATGVNDLSVLGTSWIWVRAQIEGSTIRWKHWLSGAAEPGSWTSTVTDSAVVGAGKTGLRLSGGATGEGGGCYVDYFASGRVSDAIALPT